MDDGDASEKKTPAVGVLQQRVSAVSVCLLQLTADAFANCIPLPLSWLLIYLLRPLRQPRSFMSPRPIVKKPASVKIHHVHQCTLLR